MKGRAIDVHYDFDLVWSSHAIPRGRSRDARAF